MIESIRIEDLGVIESADLALSPGLTALTGETGAGKTMVLTSLGLLLGERAEASIVRTGAERAVVEGAFAVDPDSRAAERVRSAGGDLDEDLLLVSRTVPSEGRSRAHLGGRSVPSSVLSEVGGHLVSVHGQADQLRLRSASAQRVALDSLGGPEHAALCREYAGAYRRYLAAVRAAQEWAAGAQARQEEAARLRTWLERIEALAPTPGEDAELALEAERLDHAEDLRRAAGSARLALAGDDEAAVGDAADVVSLLAGAARAMGAVHGVDPALTGLGERLTQLGILAADVAADLGEYLAALDADPARLAWVQDRRAELARACREIGDTDEAIQDADALLAWSERAAVRLAIIDAPEGASSELGIELETSSAELARLAGLLSEARSGLARRLEEDVTTELEGLQMKGARLVVELEGLEEPGPTGAENVALLLMAHPGAPALPLGKGASGGELSRIMLGLEVVLADAAREGAGTSRAHQRTLVFDEIDAGVGGRAAREIGRRLARLARHHQVVVVTHLAQVAAWADTQLVVRKRTDPAPGTGASTDGRRGSAGRTRTDVLPVDGEERVVELARMLSGHEQSEAALRHAAELLDEARVAQSQP